MRLTCEQLDPVTVFLAGYDVDADPDWEFCAVFEVLESEQTVRLVKQHLREYEDPKKCEERMSDAQKEKFSRMLPKFYRFAMDFLHFTPFDDSLPAQPDLL